MPTSTARAVGLPCGRHGPCCGTEQPARVRDGLLDVCRMRAVAEIMAAIPFFDDQYVLKLAARLRVRLARVPLPPPH